MSPSGEPFHAPADAPYASALWFARADADHDGRITRAEFMADAEAAFHRYDTNGDGVIDGLEVAAYEEAVAPEILPRVGALANGEGMDASLFGGRGHGAGGEGPQRRARVSAGDRQLQGAGLYGLLEEPEPLTAADADLDGKITLAEWRARTLRRFELIADGAEALTLAALPHPAMQTLLERRLRADAKRRPR